MHLVTALAFLLAPPAFLLAPLTLHAECAGAANLIAALPPDQRAALQAAADGVPFAKGNLWHATRPGQDITLVGTFHLDDPRHAATLTALTPALHAARTLLVEAGPAEEAALLDHVARHPELLIAQTGPTLPEALPKADWQRLSAALSARGIPPFMAAKLRPWYLATLLAVPPCQFTRTGAMNGLDRRLMTLASQARLPILGLEPFDTIFTVFDRFAPADQMAFLMQSLSESGEDNAMAITLADSYFSGDNRLYWEFARLRMQTRSGPAEADRQFALVEDALLTRRNRAWISRIEAAAAQGPVIVAFGALHLSGENGVLNLLAQHGWALSPLAP